MIGTIQEITTNDTKEVISRYFSNQSSIMNTIGNDVGRDIRINLFEIEIPPTEETIPEEKAYLKFYPISKSAYFLELNFIIEPSNDQEYYKLYQIIYDATYFEKWYYLGIRNLLPFDFEHISEQAYHLCGITRTSLEKLFIKKQDTLDYSFIFNQSESIITLLRRALESFITSDDANSFPACSFLAANVERDKVQQTHDIILNNLDQPFTIRNLSRQVGMNECYLKKGFKAMYGKTIHEFQQTERIAKSKELLSTGKLTVNEVAFQMGYSSPSHFSTAFKKITGLKPCELLS